MQMLHECSTAEPFTLSVLRTHHLPKQRMLIGVYASTVAQWKAPQPLMMTAVTWQAGRPKTITGFQTHTTPVLLSVGDRAELASNKYLPLSSVLEGIVILKENPDYIETQE